MLVANKFQTGFDQPLLWRCTSTSGCPASRRCRPCPGSTARTPRGKDTTFVLDFVNDPEEILEAFQPYYREASLEGDDRPEPRPRHPHQAGRRRIYTEAEVDAFATAYLANRHGALTAPLKAAADRFKQRYLAAMDDGDKAAVDELEMFRKDVGSFIRLYDFLSQIINYGDTELEKRSLYLRLLRKRLHKPDATDFIDLTEVELRAIKHTRLGEQTLDLASGDTIALKPVTATGSGQARDPRLVRLEEVLTKINDLFADEDFTPGQQQSWVQSLVTVLEEDDTVQEQAAANGSKQFVESPDLAEAVTEAVLGTQESHNKMVDKFFGDDAFKTKLVKLLGELVHEDLNGQDSA